MTIPCTEKEKITEILDTVKSIHDTIHGNGAPGLKTQVAIHRMWFKLIAAIGGPILVFLLGNHFWEIIK